MKPLLLSLLACASLVGAAEIVFKADKPDGMLGVGDRAGWTLSAADAPDRPGWYALKANGATAIASGPLVWGDGRARIDFMGTEPAMVLLEVSTKEGATVTQRAGLAVSPAELRSTVAEPADFDAFWTEKLRWLRTIPMDPKVESADSGRPEVELQKVTLANVRGARVHGHLAKPSREGRFPALIVLQYAGGPYPLQKGWSVDYAAKGWLTFNIEPHDVPPDMPQGWYDALPKLLKDYQSIGDTDRERSYFLAMYLGACRAADYLTSRPEWDGRTLVAMGPSMGGQQALALTGLHAGVTHVIVHTPAGCDALAALNGRMAGYPFWNVWDARVAATAPYFDTVNFARRIRVPALVSMGFVDTTTPPHGIWMAFNALAGPKEAVPMPETPHGHLAKPGQENAYYQRRDAWLAALVGGGTPDIRTTVTTVR